MGNKIPLELQVKELGKSMVTIVKALKDLKASVKALEDKTPKSHDEDIKELVDSQKILQQIIEANSDAIKRIDVEILKIGNDKAKADLTKNEGSKAENRDKKYKYWRMPRGVLAHMSAHARSINSPPHTTKKKLIFYHISRSFTQF